LLKVTINGAVYPFDNVRYQLSEAIELEEKLGMPFAEWQPALSRGSAKALAGFVWLVLKRNEVKAGEKDISLEDVISGAYELVESEIKIEQEGGEDPTEAPSPAGDGSSSEPSPSASASAPGSGTASP
jgi:hypothetical protein